MLRIAAPVGLETEPLVHALDAGSLAAGHDARRGSWLEAAEELLAEEADVALVSPLLLGRPEAAALELEVVPGLSLCSQGAAVSMRLIATRPLSEVEGLGAARGPGEGHLAEALARLLFAESGRVLEFERGESLEGALAEGRALVLSGEDALDPGPRLGGSPDLVVDVDLGSAWQSLTGTPLVRALWMARPGRVGRETYALLHTARTRGRHAWPGLVARALAGRDEAVRGRGEALVEATAFRLGNPQLEGLARLFEALGRHEPNLGEPALRFLPLAANSACRAKAEALGLTRRPPLV